MAWRPSQGVRTADAELVISQQLMEEVGTQVYHAHFVKMHQAAPLWLVYFSVCVNPPKEVAGNRVGGPGNGAFTGSVRADAMANEFILSLSVCNRVSLRLSLLSLSHPRPLAFRIVQFSVTVAPCVRSCRLFQKIHR